MVQYSVFFLKNSLSAHRLLFFFALFLSFLGTSCKIKTLTHAPRIDIGDSFYYWEPTEAEIGKPSAASDLGDALSHYGSFKKLEDKSIYNLRHVLGKGSHYVWIRAEFEIPEQFQNQPLGLVVPHLRFAEQLWCNNTFISQYGAFSPHEQSTLFKAHFFSFPRSILRQTNPDAPDQKAINTILIKIYAQGRSGISTHAFIQPTNFAYGNFEVINFHHARFYIFFVGILLFTFVLYLALYIRLPSFKEFRDFALVNLFTMFFITPFFATEFPLYTNGIISFVPFIKFNQCISFYISIYFATLFALDYLQMRIVRSLEIVRLGILAVQIITTIAAPSYEALIDIMPVMLGLVLVQGGFGAGAVVRQFLHKKKRSIAIQFGLGFLPLSTAVALDIILRLHDNTIAYPYYSVFGWVFSIVVFIILLSYRFAHMYQRNELLTNHLQEEVDTRTQDLRSVNYELARLNEHLEEEKFKADMDLQMASLVQQRFFPQPNKQFRGWDIAVYYNPSAIVSGDLYDYYNFNEELNGLALFDVSGHGISASLVTMLAKNIISHAFQKGFRTKEPVDSILSRINNIILSEKGDIDNYLTGILCRFESDKTSDVYKVELGNAGHPYPLKFSAQDNEVFELRGNDGKKHYGAIGLKGVEISFAKSDFIMSQGDLLICYTDGLTEALNADMKQFGIERVKQLVKENSLLSANELLKCIIKNHAAFTKGKSKR